MKQIQGDLLQNESLANHTSWRVGGPAQQLYKPYDLNDLAIFLSQLPKNEDILWLGLGSNVLVRDGGYPGTVILTQARLKELAFTADHTIRAEAGVACATLARFSARQSLTGLEFMAGIPGTVGGALNMNAGCFNGETWDFVVAVETIDQHGTIHRRTPEEYQVAYREVVAQKEQEWFVAGYFSCPTGDKETSLQMIRDLLARRTASQPTGEHSCGSVFRNPPNDYAGRLIEACGLKGYQHGGAQISEKHANFIINTGNASAKDIEETIDIVHKRVKEEFNIDLHREVHIIGVEQ